MVQLTTQKVTVSAQSFYQGAYSNPAENQYVYAYHIEITNRSKVPVTLMDRVWEVIDASGERRVVEGKGVVGKQPEILPGHSHKYTSWVQYETPIGAMQGSYGMIRHDDRGQVEHFSVVVPRFLHIAPEVNN